MNNIVELVRTYNVFNKNNWIEKDNEKEVFERYCERLRKLKTKSQKNLFFELTERFIWINNEDYSKEIKLLLDKCFKSDEYLKNDNYFFIFAMDNYKNKPLSKSSNAVAYLTMASEIRTYVRKYGKDYRLLNSLDEIKKCTENNNHKILVIDDFVGTGDKTEKCINRILNIVNNDRIIVGSIIAQENGINHIKDLNIKIVNNITVNRGISDNYQGQELIDNIETMKEIEKDLLITRFNFGYGSSEALVSMIRTPNNTFPVFWDEDDNKGKAPFPRY